MIKPGCGGVPTFTYINKLQFTLLLLTFSALLFALACLARLCLRARTITRTVAATVNDDELDHELDELADDDPVADTEGQVEGQPSMHRIRSHPSRRARRPSTLWKGLTPHQRRVMERSAQLSAVWLDFKHRLCHSLLILLSIFYLRLTTLLFKALVCDHMPNRTAPMDSSAVMTESLFLREDGQTACWSGSHVSAAASAVLLLLLYSAGFPFFCFVLLVRAFTDESSTGAIGWLRRHFSWLRDRRLRRAFTVAVAPAPTTQTTTARNTGEARRPASPSRSGWLQEPGGDLGADKKDVPTARGDGPALVKAPSLPAASAHELLQAAKLQRRRE